jgi:hypothetical protein
MFQVYCQAAYEPAGQEHIGRIFLSDFRRQAFQVYSKGRQRIEAFLTVVAMLTPCNIYTLNISHWYMNVKQEQGQRNSTAYPGYKVFPPSPPILLKFAATKYLRHTNPPKNRKIYQLFRIS